MMAEARLLRQHKGRLEARMQILEEHNRQLEAQLQRLRKLLEEVTILFNFLVFSTEYFDEYLIQMSTVHKLRDFGISNSKKKCHEDGEQNKYRLQSPYILLVNTYDTL